MKILKKIVAGLIFLSFNINTVFAGVLSGKRIVIDPGHGGSDPGAVSGQVREKDINNSVARKLADLLKAEGAEVIFTREPENDIDITLSDRVNISNSVNPDLFISIHNNSSTSSAANGVETYYSLVRPNILNSKYADYGGNKYPVLRESSENNINYVYILMGDKEVKVEKTKVKIVYKYLEYEGNKYECLRESRENDVDYVYILVDGKEVKVEKNKVKIVYSPNPWQALESKRIAEIIVNNLASLGFKYRGAKDSNLYVTRNTTSPSVLLELGFITNPDDRQKLIDPIYQESIAQKILQSLLSYYEVYENNKIKAFGMPEKDLVLSRDKILLGDSIDFTFKGIEDTLLKKVEIKYCDEVVATSESQFMFTPNKDGEFEAILYLKSPDSVNEYDEVISKKFNVYKYPTIKNIILSPDNPTSKKNISISIEKENGSLVGCDYTFEIYKGERLVFASTSDNSLINFVPNEDREYKLIVKLKDKLSKNEYDDIKEVSFIVRPEEAASRGTNTQNQTAQVNNGILKINRVLKKGMTGEDVRELQRALIKLGYLKISTPTITFGPSTETAVKAFQRANRLNDDGIVGKTTIDRINLSLARLVNNTQVSRGNTNQNATNNQLLNITRVLMKGMTGEDVRELQRALIRLGYLKISTPTTTFGPTTEAAVKAFQRANKLTDDGIVGKTTVDKINSLLKNRF